jgi:hypothetical protein
MRYRQPQPRITQIKAQIFWVFVAHRRHELGIKTHNSIKKISVQFVPLFVKFVAAFALGCPEISLFPIDLAGSDSTFGLA